ncbi:maleylpyruvate isomerase N-terminal domain-containing protein, partial [Kibdelosporangium lantanae]
VEGLGRINFGHGLVDRNGITGDLAERIYEKMLAFSNFGFPESHALSFAHLVFASSYFKLYHPAAFCAALLLTPDSDRPTWPTPPDEWDELLTWWDTTRATMLDRLAAADPAKPVWGFVPEFRTVGWWGRRQAHETAIHRLDAEHAAHETVPTLIFDPEFASDGIDEVVAMMSPFRARVKRPEVTVEGTLLIHAAD